MNLKISEIKIGQRARQDIGDIEGLAKSIKEHGLLHPIITDSCNNLVAGARRLEACKTLGWLEIEVKNIGEITLKKLRRIELEENIRRKDLAVTEYEKSKQLVELAELVAEELREENKKKDVKNNTDITCEVARNSGRPKSENSIREMAKVVGVPPKTLHDAKQHVAAIEKYPELKELPKTKAMETAKKLDTLPEEELTSFQQKVEELRQQSREEIRNRTPEEKLQVRAENYRKVTDRMVSFFSSLSAHPVNEYFYGLSKVEHLFNGIQFFTKNHLDMVDAGILWLQDYRRKYAEIYLKEKIRLKVVRKDEN